MPPPRVKMAVAGEPDNDLSIAVGEGRGADGVDHYGDAAAEGAGVLVYVARWQRGLWQGSLKLDRREDCRAAADAIVNQRIAVNITVKQTGQQVGNGECWTLADEALKAGWGPVIRAPSTGGEHYLPDEGVYPGDVDPVHLGEAGKTPGASRSWACPTIRRS